MCGPFCGYLPIISTTSPTLNHCISHYACDRFHKKEAKLDWDDDYEQAIQSLKKSLVQPPFLAYSTIDGPFILSMEDSDTRMGRVLQQEQEENDRVVKRVIAYASKVLNTSQRHHCTTNKELLAVVTAVKLFKYYLTGRIFTVMTDHASLTWLHKFWEPERVVARWIPRLQPFLFFFKS